jgi:hypothetical protein
VKVEWLTFWICVLACYRITVLISRDLGPLRIFKRLREGYYFSAFLRCPFCVSIYVGGFISLGLWFSGFSEPLFIFLCLPFAFSGVTIALDRTFSADHQT